MQNTTVGSMINGSGYPCDMGIIKFNASGTSKIWGTYIGGADNDQPHSMIVDANNNLIIAGRTYSNDFPVSHPGYDTSHNGGADIVVVKLNATATALLGSTYIGGSADDGVNIDADEFNYGNLKHNYGDDARSEVLVDNQGNIYLTASTRSTDFPTTANALQTVLMGSQDAVVMKLNSNLSALTWSTYMGGSSEDAGYVLALDVSQTHLYVAGGTASSDFPVTGGTLFPAYQGGIADGYIVRFLNAPPYTHQKTTFMGTSGYDQCYGVQVDLQDNVYAMGQTLGGGFPVTTGVYSNPNSSQFVIKLNPDLSNNIYSTVFGSGDPTLTNISPVAFLVDTCQNVYISGWGGTLGFNPVSMPGVGNTLNMPLSTAPNTPAQSTTDGFDFYFIVFSKDAQSLLYGSYYGRNSTDAGKGEHVDGGTSRFDKDGIVYQAICGGCAGNPGVPTSSFPTTPGSYSPNNGFPSNCNEVALKIAFEFVLRAKLKVLPDTTGCPPFTVQVQNTSTYGLHYEWDFGDGSQIDTSITPPPHTYNDPGVYIIRLIGENITACNKTIDTAYATIKVDSVSIKPAFNLVKTDSCGPLKVAITNTSQYSSTPGSQSFTVFHWDFGDGTSYNGPNPPEHTYADSGTYTVTLTMTDSTACNSPDSTKKTIDLHYFYVRAAFNSPDSICFGGGLVFANGSSNATTITWYFGDGDSTHTSSPGHTYLAPGTYIVTLIVTNPNSCNGADTVRRTIKIKALPIADFTYSPAIPIPNEPIVFTNLSQNATRYVWSFGDGTGSSEVNPTHLYKKTDGYTVCLEARNEDACPDTVCKTVYADIHPAVDVPTGFSPNGDGENDVLYVRGAAIQKMDFKLFNRWGQLIFETKSLEIGWDGTYKGKQQEMEAYAYVLEVEFIDGSTVHKSGNVTLLR